VYRQLNRQVKSSKSQDRTL